jgi:hypothetical protein
MLANIDLIEYVQKSLDLVRQRLTLTRTKIREQRGLK